MIDFRYHLVSLVSVFLALAVGIVLGAGPLKGTIGDSLSSQVAQLRAEKADLRTERDTEAAAVDNRDVFTREVLPTLVRGRLVGESVLVVTLPGADADAVKPLTESLTAAGAKVTGHLDIKESWTDPARASDRESVLRSFGTASPTSAPAPVAPAGSGAAPIAAAPTVPTVPVVSGAGVNAAALSGLLGRAVLTRDLGLTGPLDAEGKRLLDGLRKGGLVGVDGDVTGRATEVVVLAPGVDLASGGQPSASASATADRLAKWSALAAGLDVRSDGTVVVGPASSATSGGLVETLRGMDTVAGSVSTVDTGSTPMGDIATVLALREQALGGAGSYGFVGKVKAPLPALTEVTK